MSQATEQSVAPAAGGDRPKPRPCKKCGDCRVIVAGNVEDEYRPVALDAAAPGWVLFRDPDTGRLHCWKGRAFLWRLQQVRDGEAVLRLVAGVIDVLANHADTCPAAAGKEGQ